MADLTPSITQPSLVAPTLAASGPDAASPAELAKRAHIAQTAQKFEASFLSIMVQQMFAGVDSADGPFGGGPGEQMFQSFMADAMANKMVKGGGIGLAASVQREMLKMQGLN